MKSNLFLAGTLLAAGIFVGNAQTTLNNSSITSGGVQSGTFGSANAFYGYQAGKDNTATGLSNTFIGSQSGFSNTTGDNNVFIGTLTGTTNSTGSNNVYIGNAAGNAGDTSINNTYVGSFAGYDNEGSGNVFVGNRAGEGTSVSNKLFIDNTSNASPLIWGDFSTDQLKFNGKVGIGLNAANFPNTAGSINVQNYRLIVSGGVLATEVRVATTWADYVFEKGYKLPSLLEVEKYIADNGHLPNVPSAKTIEADGIEVGNMAKIQQEKIEELTLYAIQQQKQIDQQQKEIDELKAAVKVLVNKQ
ncbi:hypothetical protein ACLI09_13430 [Flavobacterium sp. RHBU_24]|uniref:hypothetical protein n=1 Tax=Flavobacterium sp. RHBU_24 TaxID=3391185 RepID=UPI0039854E60